MGKYSRFHKITKKKCREMNICHKCGGTLELLKTRNGFYLYKTRCKICFTQFGGKNSVKNNPQNPNFKSKKNKKLLKSTQIDKPRVRIKRVALETYKEKCPLCGCILYIRNGKFGKFAGCINYPHCKYSKNLENEYKQTKVVKTIATIHYAKNNNNICRERMTKEKYADYLLSEHWLNFKKEYYKRYERICSKCGSEDDIQLHHKTYENRGFEKFEDIILLCRKCHQTLHDDRKKKKKKKMEKRNKQKRKRKHCGKIYKECNVGVWD